MRPVESIKLNLNDSKNAITTNIKYSYFENAKMIAPIMSIKNPNQKKRIISNRVRYSKKLIENVV